MIKINNNWKLKEQRKTFVTEINASTYIVGIYYSPDNLFSYLDTAEITKVVFANKKVGNVKQVELWNHFYPIETTDEYILEAEFNCLVNFEAEHVEEEYRKSLEQKYEEGQ